MDPLPSQTPHLGNLFLKKKEEEGVTQLAPWLKGMSNKMSTSLRLDSSSYFHLKEIFTLLPLPRMHGFRMMGQEEEKQLDRDSKVTYWSIERVYLLWRTEDAEKEGEEVSIYIIWGSSGVSFFSFFIGEEWGRRGVLLLFQKFLNYKITKGLRHAIYPA